MGELHDFEAAKRERDSARGIRPGILDRLAGALGMRGDKPSHGTIADLERVADSPEADPEVRQVAREISDILHDNVREIVIEQEGSE